MSQGMDYGMYSLKSGYRQLYSW